MAQQTWETIPKSQDDNSLITDAIADAIDDHNNDVDAHLGDNQALKSHRAAVIIDHLAESVVNDKLKPNARTYVAIVDNDSPADYDNIEDALDYAVSLGGGTVFVRRGNYTPARQLNFRYGVDLIGEGPGETVIIRTDGVNDYMALTDGPGISVKKIMEWIFSDGSDAVEVTLPGGITTADLTGMYVDTEYGDGNILGEIDAAQISFYQVPDYSGTLYDVEPKPRITGTTGSDEVYVHGWKMVDEMPSGDGYRIQDGNGFSIGYVQSYDGAGTYTLTEPLGDNVDAIGLSFGVEGERLSVIQGVTIDCAGVKEVFDVQSTQGRAFIRDSAFTNCKSLFTGDASRITMENCTFSFNTSTVSLEIAGAKVRNCQFSVAGTSACTGVGGFRGVFENCVFSSGLGSGYNHMSNVVFGTTFNFCEFSNFAAGTIVNSSIPGGRYPSQQTKFVGCAFTNSTGASILIYGVGIIVSSTSFHLTPSNSINFHSSARGCILVGCTVYGTIGSAVTGNIYSGNNAYTTW